MSAMPTINLVRPIVGVCLLEAAQLGRVNCIPESGSGVTTVQMEAPVPNPQSEIRTPQSDALQEQLQHQQEELARQLETLRHVAESLHTLHEQTLPGNRVEIAKLAVEIARKILMYKVGKGDYEIQAIVEEALKQAPTRQNIVVHLNPEDLPRCQEYQQASPQSPWADLELTADWSIGRGECLVETPKGVVRSFIEEHLERISEAMQRVE